MKFFECIDLAIASGRLKPGKGNEAKAAWQTAYDEARFRGLSDRAADDAAAVAAVERLGKKTADEQWSKINEIRVAADHFATFTKTENPVHELYWLSNKLDVTARRITDETHTMIANNLEAWRPLYGGTYIPIKGMDEIIHAFFPGKAVSAEAAKMAEEIWNAREFLRKRANMEGANLTSPPGKKSIPLMQTREKLVAHARSLDKLSFAKGKAEWINDHMVGNDWSMVVDRSGGDIPEHQREAFLSDLYDSLTTSGNLHKEPTAKLSMALAKRLSHPEYFHYKDAETWLKMNEKYGLGDIYKQLISTIHMRSKDIALLEHFGPKPDEQIAFIDNIAMKRAAELDRAAGPQAAKNKEMQYKTEKELHSFKQGFELFAGRVPDPEGWYATIGGNLRGVLSPLILGNAFLSNLGDLGMAKHALMFYKMPATGIIRKIGASMKNMTTEEGRRFAVRNLGALESNTSLMLNEARYSGMMDGSYWVKRFNESFFRASGMTLLTQGERHGGMWHLLGEFADQSKTAFKDLPWVEHAKEYGITQQEWDTFRKTPLREQDTILHPFDVLKRTDLDRVEARRLADKFYDFALDINQRVAPTVTTRIRVALGEATNPNTGMGQLARSFGYIKNFGAMIFMTYLKDIRGQTNGSRAKSIAQFVTTLTLAGALITQLKALVSGKDMEDMNPLTNPGFWIKSALNGGSFGFMGDIVFGTLGAFQHGGVADLVAGPIPPFIDRVKNFTIDDQVDFLRTYASEGPTAAFAKYRGAKDLAGLVTKYNPVPWQFKLMMQRLVLDDVLKSADPRAYQTLLNQQTERAGNGQQAWWPVGSKAPVRTPNPGAALGF